jgi:uncharacterized protein with HEPN domain
MKQDQLHLIHIAECIGRIERYTIAGRSAFLADTMIQDAVLRNLHTLSESTQRLSDALKARYPAVDWRSIAAFRNVVVHDYLGVDPVQVWDILEHDLPELKGTIAAMLEERS